MIRLFTTALAAALTFGLAGISLAAPALTSLTVDGSMAAEGTVGSALTITGSELGTKAPKAVLQLHGDATAKPFALKLAKPFDGSTLHASVVKITPGVYDLVVTVKGSDPLTIQSAFTARAPRIDSLGSTKIAPGDHLDILGRFFGNKKGKVTIGDVTAKVFGNWTDGKITVIVSKKNKSGSVTIDIFGKGGLLDNGATADVVAPIAGNDSLVITFNNGGKKLVANNGLSASETGFYQLNGTERSGSNVRQFLIDTPITAPGTPYTGPVTVVLQGFYNGSSIYYDDDGSWTVTITQRVGQRVAGTFSGNLKKTIGNGAANYHVEGTFTLPVQ